MTPPVVQPPKNSQAGIFAGVAIMLVGILVGGGIFLMSMLTQIRGMDDMMNQVNKGGMPQFPSIADFFGGLISGIAIMGVTSLVGIAVVTVFILKNAKNAQQAPPLPAMPARM